MIAVALLVINDHWLKPAFGNWWTGKLSDLAGMTFFPLTLQAAWEVAIQSRSRPFLPSRQVLLICVLATALVFTSLQLFPFATEAYRHGLGALQWPFKAAFSLLTGDGLPPLSRVQATPDSSDLLALPALLLPLFVGRQRAAAAAAESRSSPHHP